MKLLAIETSSAQGSVALFDGETTTERAIATAREQTALVLPHANALLADAGLALRDLDAIVFGRGPGSFTGLRIATAIAQGLAMAGGLPVIGVSSLEALARRAHREFAAALGVDEMLVCVDARMQEVYFAHYRVAHGQVAHDRAAPDADAGAGAAEGTGDPGASGGRLEDASTGRPDDASAGRLEPVGEERLLRPEQVAPSPGRWVAVGSGFGADAEALAAVTAHAVRVEPALTPLARDLLPTAAGIARQGGALAPEAALPVYLRDERAWRRQGG